jgi:hypothetical protein
MAKKGILTLIGDALAAREQLQQDGKELEKALKKAKQDRVKRKAGK